MREARVLMVAVALAAAAALLMGGMSSSRGGGGTNAQGILALPVYDADGDGDADGNPANPAMGDVWRNGAPGCNWPMIETPLGHRCIGTDACPMECF